jgi:hypothetical protein
MEVPRRIGGKKRKWKRWRRNDKGAGRCNRVRDCY